MKKILTTLAISFASIVAFSQQDPQFTQFMYNKLFMNPAYAGMKHSLCFTGIARQQWAGFDGSPRTGNFSADCYIPKLSGGLGVNFMYDQLGFETNKSARIDYSFHRKLGRGVIGMGLELGVFSKHLGPTGGDQWLASSSWQSDPTIPQMMNKRVGDMGAGLWYENSKIWFGISTTHINGKLMNGQDEMINNVLHPVLYQMARHYFITGGANLTVSPAWEIRPSFLVKTDGVITSVDLNAIAMYRGVFWMGVSYRFKDAICPMLGVEWTRMKPAETEAIANSNSYTVIRPARQGGTVKLGFAYDYTTSQLRSYNSGTFELFVNYCMPIKWPVKREGHFDVRIIDRPDQP